MRVVLRITRWCRTGRPSEILPFCQEAALQTGRCLLRPDSWGPLAESRGMARSLASPMAARLNFSHVGAVLAFDRAIRLDGGLIGTAAIATVPTANDVLHRRTAFSPKAGDGARRNGFAVPSEGIGETERITRRFTRSRARSDRCYAHPSCRQAASDSSREPTRYRR